MSVNDHIVVAVDFSEPSEVAVRAASKIALATGAKKMTVLHALRPTVLPHGDMPQLKSRLQQLRDKIQAAALQQMQTMCASTAAQAPYEVDYKVVEGTPAKVIGAGARDIGGTLLCLGTHSRRGFRRWLKGSVVEAMLPRLRLPTLVFPVGDDGVPPELELENLKHVTVAIDIRDHAAFVAKKALEMLSLLRPKPAVTLMTVVELEDAQIPVDHGFLAEVNTLVEQDAVQRLETIRTQMVEAGFSVEIDVRIGDVEDEILAAAKDKPSQLVLMGTHIGPDLVLDFTSTAAEVIRRSNSSVLVVPYEPASSEE